jgi:hypothetical protein
VFHLNSVAEPATTYGFLYGSGGGTSTHFYYDALCPNGPSPICARQLPDVAFLADPYTGVQVIHTTNFDPSNSGSLVIEIGSGTSLAVQLFTGLWAVTNEYHAVNVAMCPVPSACSLGLAAPYLYFAEKYYPSAITDIQESSYQNMEKNNVTGCEHRLLHRGCHPSFSAGYLVAPLDGTTSYVSVLASNTPNLTLHAAYWDVLTFGTDSSLHTTPGWDNVTGVGVPNGSNFLMGTALYAPRCVAPTC